MFIKTFLVILVIFGILDFLWLGIVSGNLYPTAIQNIQGSPLKLQVLGAVVAYFLMTLSLSVLFEKKVIQTPDDALFWGAFLGLVVYGVFNGTNHAIFKRWDLKTSIYDTMWGVFLYTFTAYTTTQILPYVNKI